VTHVVRPVPLSFAFVALGGAIALARGTSAPWWIVPLGVIGPDLSFLAALGGPPNVGGAMPPRVVRPYNLVHHPFGPTALLLAGACLGSPTAVGAALAWGSHLLWDRGVGYGMRRADGTLLPSRTRTWGSSLVR
jgi:hypothetical protein